MVDKSHVRSQLITAVENTEYPITGPFDLIPALPNGAETRIESGEFEITAMELTTELPEVDFPYDTPEAFVDDVMVEMENEGLL
ncbi:MTH865 family protein [Haloarcula amylolytica]|uniref:MTH865 family protein n=1 Tax=Haloarcula amylolytica TaxID=396317 RepID=UPI000677D04B|nr:MTH865 family protein [Haloarcula amylolytica]